MELEVEAPDEREEPELFALEEELELFEEEPSLQGCKAVEDTEELVEEFVEEFVEELLALAVQHRGLGAGHS